MDRGYDTRSPIQKKSSLPRTFTLFRVYILAALVLFGVSLSLVIAHAPLFEIRTVVVSGAMITPNENIQMYIAKVLEGNWRAIFPLNSVVSIPIKTLQKNITTTFPSVASLRIDRVGFSQIQVSLVERIPVQTYCREENCVLIDKDGIIFATGGSLMDIEKIQGSPSEFLRRSATTSHDTLTFGTPLLPLASRISLDKARTFLVARGFQVANVSLSPLGFFDVTAIHKDSQSKVEFRFRDTKKIDEQIGELHLAFEKGLRQKIIDNTVEYVISYVPQKVIYKNTEK